MVHKILYSRIKCTVTYPGDVFRVNTDADDADGGIGGVDILPNARDVNGSARHTDVGILDVRLVYAGYKLPHRQGRARENLT